MDEFPPGASGPGAEPDYSAMSIEDRLASKVWKARVSAYETLSATFSRTADESDPAFRPYLRDADKLRAMVTDSNAVAQEKGVECVRKFVEFAGREGGRATRESVLPSLVDKCLGSTRAGTKKAALELVLLYVEMEDNMGSEAIVANICEPGLKSKQPKVVAACVAALKEMIRLFGPKQVAAKAILKRLPDVFAHPDKGVRAEGAELAKELYRYIGSAIDPTLDKLKEIQAKELRAGFEGIQVGATPERYLYSEKAKAEAAAAAAAAASAGAGAAGAGAAVQAEEEEAGPAMDAYDLAEPIDPFKAKEWPAEYDEWVNSKKWSERRDALQGAQAALKTSPKLSPAPAGQYDALVNVCAERIAKDSNIVVVCEACACLELLAKGLRDWFGPRYREKIVPPLIEKLKERKQNVLDACSGALDATFQTLSFSAILEDIIAGTKHKNPNVKAESIRFLVRCLKTTRSPPSKADIKPIAEALVVAIGDANGDVRDAGAAGLGTLMKLVGERPMNQFVEQLDDIKKGKVKEQFAIAEVKVKMGGASAAPVRAAAAPAVAAAAPAVRRAPPVTVSTSPIRPRTTSDKENVPLGGPSRGIQGASSVFDSGSSSPAKGPPARMPIKRPVAPSAAPAPKRPVAAAGPAPKAGGGKSGVAAAAAATEPVKFRFTPEDAEAKAVEVIPASLTTLISSANWKERLEGMTNLNTWLASEAASVESEIIVRALGKKPGWKESNFQVLSEVYKALRQLAENAPTFGRASVALSVQPLCEKLGDIKLKTAAGDTLILYAEKTSFGFLLAQALKPLASIKAPKAIADSLTWVDQAILEFGFQGVDVRSLVDHLVDCLKSANAAVRTSATKVFGTVARYVGAALKTFIGDLNAQLQSSIEAEIEKAASNPPPEPTKFSAELQAKASASASAGGGAAGPSAAAAVDALDDLIPRQSIDKLIPSATIAQLGHANWKERKEGLEQIQSILEANQRLKPEMSELTAALKLRYADSNMQCKTLALDIVSRIARGMGRGFDAHARTFVPPVTGVLADAKAPMRASASAALTAIAEAVTLAPMVPAFAGVLETKVANPMLKQDFFTWLAAWMEPNPPDKSIDLAPLALPALVALEDKLAAVRKAAQACLPFIIARAGYKYVIDQTSSLKAASRNTVIPLIDAARAQAPKAPAAAPTAAAAPAAAVSRAPSAAMSRASVASAMPAPASPASKASAVSRAPLAKAPSAVARSLRAPVTSRPMSAAPSSDDGPMRARVGAGPKRPNGASATEDSSSDKAPPLATSDVKFKVARERKDARGVHWVAADAVARPEFAEVLRAQCEHHVSQSALDAMFSRDHNAERDFLAVLTLLADFIGSPDYAAQEYGLSAEDVSARVMANADLIFKYITLRLTDNNTSISLKCLDILDLCVDLLREQRYNMSDYEGSCLLPCVLAKFGDPKVSFRDRIREILRKTSFIYPPSKLLHRYLEEGLPSKNARVRTECLTEIGYIFAKNGLHICTPGKVLPVVGKQIGDRDANVRQAALGALSEAYKIVGESIYQLCGDMPAKDRSMLEERLKRVPAGKTAAKPASPRPTKSAQLSRIGRASMLPAPGGAPRGTRPSMAPKAAAPSLSQRTAGPSRAAQDADDQASLMTESALGSDLSQTIQDVLSSDLDQSGRALKIITDAIEDNDSELPQHADQIVIVYAKQFRRAFVNVPETKQTTRLRRFLIIGTQAFFNSDEVYQDRTLASYVTKEALMTFLTELLPVLNAATRAEEEDDLKKYAKFLNIIVLRSFGSCDLNVLYDSCFSMMLSATEDLDELTGEDLKRRHQFAELTIKCIWKFTKALPHSLREGLMDPSRLFLACENFLQAIPGKVWRERQAKGVPLGESPLRTIKSIVQQSAIALGTDEALAHLDLIANPEHSQVYEWLMRISNSRRGASADGDDVEDEGKTTASAPASPSPRQRTSRASLTTPATPLSPNSSRIDEEASAELLDIFDRISNKELSREAIRDLYEFQKKYPHKQASIERSLQSTGPIFQRYIKRALANHATEDGLPATTNGSASRPDSIRMSTDMQSRPESFAAVDSRNSLASDGSHSHGQGFAPQGNSNGYSTESIQSAATATTSSSGSSAGTTVFLPASSSAAADERLAELRARFGRPSSMAPRS